MTDSCLFVRRPVVPVCRRPHGRTIASATESGRGVRSALLDAALWSLTQLLFSVGQIRFWDIQRTFSSPRRSWFYTAQAASLYCWVMFGAGGSVRQQRRPKKWQEMGGHSIWLPLGPFSASARAQNCPRKYRLYFVMERGGRLWCMYMPSRKAALLSWRSCFWCVKTTNFVKNLKNTVPAWELI